MFEKRHILCKILLFSLFFFTAAGGYLHAVTYSSAADNFLLNYILMAAVPGINCLPFFIFS